MEIHERCETHARRDDLHRPAKVYSAAPKGHFTAALSFVTGGICIRLSSIRIGVDDRSVPGSHKIGEL
jgi:hypothetical protein